MAAQTTVPHFIQQTNATLANTFMSQLKQEWVEATYTKLRAAIHSYDQQSKEIQLKLFFDHFLHTDAHLSFQGCVPDLAVSSYYDDVMCRTQRCEPYTRKN